MIRDLMGNYILDSLGAGSILALRAAPSIVRYDSLMRPVVRRNTEFDSLWEMMGMPSDFGETIIIPDVYRHDGKRPELFAFRNGVRLVEGQHYTREGNVLSFHG